MRIDAHHHFWTQSTGFYDWLTPDLNAIYRDFTPSDLAPHLSDCHIDATFLVQAAPCIEETELLLAQAEKTNFVKAVIGWADMESDSFARDLKYLAQHRLFKGLRPMVQDLANPNWLTKQELAPAFTLLSDNGFVFEALVRPPQWQALLEFASRYPSQSIVIDHAAKPAIAKGLNGEGGFSDWARVIDQLATYDHVSCKLSGLLTEAAPGAGLDDITPYLDHLYDSFGPDRLMWGSDWPVLKLNGDYTAWIKMMDTWLEDKPLEARTQIWATTAAQRYGISDHNGASQAREASSW